MGQAGSLRRVGNPPTETKRRLPTGAQDAILPHRVLEVHFRNLMQVGLETPVTMPVAVSLPVDSSILKIPMLSEP